MATRGPQDAQSSGSAAASTQSGGHQGLNISSESVGWLLDASKSHPQTGAIAEAFFFGVFDLKRSSNQPYSDKIMASCNFKSGSQRYNAVAQLRTNGGGQQELLNVQIREIGSREAPLFFSSDAAYFQ